MDIGEENEKYHLFENEILNEEDFTKKIKDIFRLQYFEKLQDILILQKNQFLEQIEQEVLFILKKIYSEQIITNLKFNLLFKSSFQDFESKYNSEFRSIHSKYDFFLRLQSKSIKTNNSTDIEALSCYYFSNFRRHCLNHTGPALHKCGHAEKGKLIKIILNINSKNYLSNETTYIICEECKKVFTKDLFNNYCSFCKESYLCSIISLRESKDSFLISYSNPHCDTFINRTIPCKFCKERLYFLISDQKIKCLKCNYVLDTEGKNEFNWQCPKCNKYFKSNFKYYNPSENFILTKILKKALLLKIKARPQYMNCCDIKIKNSSFFHKKECKGLLYLCNIENYFLKNKSWAIVCEKCQAINNCKNFIWTCPKCGKRTRETEVDCNNFNNNVNDIKYLSPKMKEEKGKNVNLFNFGNDNKNITNENKDDNNGNDENIKRNLNKRYLSEHRLKQSYSQLIIKENISNNNIQIRKSVNEEDDEVKIISRINRLDKDNLKLNLLNNEKVYNNNNKCYIIHRRRNYQINTLNNQNHLKNREEINTNFITKPNLAEKEEKINNNENKNLIPIPIPRYANIINNSNNLQYNKKDEEQNINKKVLRSESYKSSLVKEKNEMIKNDDIGNENSKTKNYEKNNSAFKINLKKNIPVRLKYSNKNNKPSNYLRDSFDDINNNNNLIEKNNEEFLVKKNLICTSVDGVCTSKKSSNENEYISKETTSQCSKNSVNSLSKELNTNLKINLNLNLKQPDLQQQNEIDNSKDRSSVSPNYNYNFRNKRKYYIQEKEKRPSNDNININNEKNNNTENQNIVSINKNSPYKFKSKNYLSPSRKFTYIEKQQKEKQNIKIKKEKNNNDKPDDVIEPQDIDFNKDIQINDPKIKQDKKLYSEIQMGIKKILEKGRLPQFNIDNYTIEKKIGDGAFGVLFSVSNNKTNKKYALKKLTATDLTSLEDFQKEFEIAYKNNHDNILNLYGICIRVYDVTTYVLFFFLVLAEHDWEIEILNRNKEKKFYTEIELIDILKQLSSACVYLQKKEIAHRDIKPENILLFFDKKEEPALYKICDFGEAKEKIRVGSRHKSIRGTDFYMSPILFKALMEKENSVRDDPYKSDVFSLGYCMIIASVLDFNFINKIRKVEEQRQIDRIIREALEERYSYKFIYVLLKMIVHNEKERIDFLGLERLIKDKF